MYDIISAYLDDLRLCVKNDIEEDILKGMKPAVRKQIKSVDYELGDGDFSVTLVDGNTGIYNIDDDIIF